MDLPQPTTPAGKAGLDTILEHPESAVVAVDFDGTLAPIVDDPQRARIAPEALRALVRLAPRVDAVVVVTGRPAAVAVEYGGFAGTTGLEHLVVLGHYGLERWDAVGGRVRSPQVPPGVAAVRALLPGTLDRLGAWRESYLEDKGSALAVHTRRARDPHALMSRLHEPLARLADQHGLVLEPGRLVLELRPAGMDKGQALVSFLGERNASAVLYAGDDLGDLAAFDAVERLRRTGTAGVTVCSGSAGGSEQVVALAERADLVVAGPHGIASLLDVIADHVAG